MMIGSIYKSNGSDEKSENLSAPHSSSDFFSSQELVHAELSVAVCARMADFVAVADAKWDQAASEPATYNRNANAEKPG